MWVDMIATVYKRVYLFVGYMDIHLLDTELMNDE